MAKKEKTRADLEREFGRLVYQKAQLEKELLVKNEAVQKIGAALEALDGK